MGKGWDAYGSFKKDRDNFNVVVSGSKFLGVGRHSVHVESVERIDGLYGPQLKVIYADSEGKTISEFIGLFDTNKQGEIVDYGYRLRMLLSAITEDTDLLFEFIESTRSDVTKFDGLQGLGFDILVEEGKKGYTIKKEGENVFVYDVASGKRLLGDSGYADFTTAQAAVEVFNTQNPDDKLRRAYNRIASFHLTDEEAKNVSALQATITATSATAGGISKPSFRRA